MPVELSPCYVEALLPTEVSRPMQGLIRQISTFVVEYLFFPFCFQFEPFLSLHPNELNIKNNIVCFHESGELPAP